jgi:hypothetical protein
MADLQRRIAIRESPAVFQSLGIRLNDCVAHWVNERADERHSWLVSLVLHLAFLVLLFLCPFALSGDNHADRIGAIVTRLESGDESGSPDDGLFFAAKGTPNDPSGTGNRPDTAGGDSLVEWSGLDLMAARAGNPAAGDFADGTALPDPSASDISQSAVIDFNRDQGRKVAAPGAGKNRGKASPAKVQGSGKDELVNHAGILDGRGSEARSSLAKSAGGTKLSEKAVDLGLEWLVRHQQPDGSWSFQHGPDDPGTLECPMGATGLALLAFMGAGHTHQKGKYRSQVNMGLKYLVDHMEENNLGGWLQGTGRATMYVQGIGTIALCEMCSMTKDPNLRRPAQLAVNFIVKAQDPEGGGWRYRIPQAGDTSVLGWQLMALQSARIAELNFPPQVITRAGRFLKSVELDGGGTFGYTDRRSPRRGTTSVALLCRMYLGRSQENKGMIRGMNNLSKWGPDPSDMYYCYYATQAMHHWGGERWAQWNTVMRDHLVATQSHSGDAEGSWITDQGHGSEMGGRLYTTCLSIMTLEVYYRYLPIYRRPSVAEPIPTSEAIAAGELSAEEAPQEPAGKAK